MGDNSEMVELCDCDAADPVVVQVMIIFHLIHQHLINGNLSNGEPELCSHACRHDDSGSLQKLTCA